MRYQIKKIVINMNCKWRKVLIWHTNKLPRVLWFVFKKPTVYVQPT